MYQDPSNNFLLQEYEQHKNQEPDGIISVIWYSNHLLKIPNKWLFNLSVHNSRSEEISVSQVSPSVFGQLGYMVEHHVTLYSTDLNLTTLKTNKIHLIFVPNDLIKMLWEGCHNFPKILTLLAKFLRWNISNLLSNPSHHPLSGT